MWEKRYDSRRKGIKERKKKDLVSRVQDRRKKAMVELGCGGTERDRRGFYCDKQRVKGSNSS